MLSTYLLSFQELAFHDEEKARNKQVCYFSNLTLEFLSRTIAAD